MRKPIRQVISKLANEVAEGPTVFTREATRTADSAHNVFRQVLGHQSAEEFWVLLLNGKHCPLGLAQVSVGTLTTSLVHPREVFGPAVRIGAAALIVAHNHPSGDPEPSAEDLAVTTRLIEVGKLLGIPVLDHLILGADDFVSLREQLPF